MEPKFEYKIKRHISICDYEKLWLKLTIGGVISLFIILKGCTSPIIFENKVLEWLICSNTDGDKTLYNIAISYIAAYIFYLFQIYFPERNKTKRVLDMTAVDACNFINQVRRFMFIWDNMAETTNDGVITRIKNKNFYYKETTYNYISEANLDELKKIAQRIMEEYNKIINSPEFQFIDLAIYKLYKEYNFDKEIIKWLMLLLGANTASETNASLYETYSRDELNSIITRMNVLSMVYGFTTLNSFEIVVDEKEISVWKDEQQKLYEHLMKNKEFFKNLPDEYSEYFK